METDVTKKLCNCHGLSRTLAVTGYGTVPETPHASV